MYIYVYIYIIEVTCDKCCFYFSIRHFERKYSKDSRELFKCSIELWALDIFPVFRYKN